MSRFGCATLFSKTEGEITLIQGRERYEAFLARVRGAAPALLSLEDAADLYQYMEVQPH